MNGSDLVYSLIDNLEKAKVLIEKINKDNKDKNTETLVADIQRNLDMYYERADSINDVLEDIEIN